ncbi:hypothetical protein SAZ11_52545 [Streptomyces sp. FXJ1.4098]|nr:hypothetical protein [Streptomyces sp. FXJ1.4098]
MEHRLSGGCCLGRNGTYYGSVDLSDGMFAERVPDIPEFFSRHFTDAHRFGLVSLVEACADAELDIIADDLGEAALLVGRGGVDSNVESYLAALRADPRTPHHSKRWNCSSRADRPAPPPMWPWCKGR